MGRLTNGDGDYPAPPDRRPPDWANWLLNRFSPAGLEDELQGDLLEMYAYWVKIVGLRRARWRYVLAVLRLIHPFTWSVAKQPNDYSQPACRITSSLHPVMLRNYFKIAFRNLARNKAYSFINIAGLATGMATAILIGLWLYDELSFNQSFPNYARIAQVMQNSTLNGEIRTQPTQPVPLAAELRNRYGDNFRYVLMTSGTSNHILAAGDKKFTKKGNFIEPQAPDMFALNMVRGTRSGLREAASILLSESVAKALFGGNDPVNKLLKIDNKSTVKVTGVYEDFPANSSFRDIAFLAPWDLYLADNEWIKKLPNPWEANVFQVFVQLAPHTDINQLSEKIRLALFKRVDPAHQKNKPELFLYPMSQWHLYSEFKQGIGTGGAIDLVWLFGIIGVFVLLLACVNFTNLSTARSEKRAKEVGIRKSVGSVRRQLITQFLSESFLVVAIAFCLAQIWVWLLVPYFNATLDKQIVIPWTTPLFWAFGVGFSLLTGLLAGSYPAFYLSSFQPIKVLKGTFNVGQFDALPRKILVIFQFTVSISLLIGTIIVFRQLQFTKNRPVGYTREGLIMLKLLTDDIHDQFAVFQEELKKSGAILEIAESSAPPTGIWATDSGFEWKGKDPSLPVEFPNTGVSYEYGKTVGWQFKEGRDFSRAFSTDSTAFVLNEAAVKFMNLNKPVGEIIRWGRKPFTVIGVINDMVVESPYQPVRPTLYSVAKSHDNFVIFRLNPSLPIRDALQKIEPIFKQYSPAMPFDYQFVDEEYAKKFLSEERIGQLASCFAILAIFISCLGMFGLASFLAEQRTKEIGVRKILGASVLNVWSLLAKDFVRLVVIAFGLAIPIAYYFLSNWLQKYQYRTELSWWIFAASGVGALTITLLTVSFQSIKAALVNPVKSLRSE